MGVSRTLYSHWIFADALLVSTLTKTTSKSKAAMHVNQSIVRFDTQFINHSSSLIESLITDFNHSLVTQRNQRVGPSRFSRRAKTGSDRDHYEQQRNAHVGKRIACAYSEEQ